MAHGDITHIDIPVSDLAAGQAFYSALFGWEIAEVPGFGPVLASAIKVQLDKAPTREAVNTATGEITSS